MAYGDRRYSRSSGGYGGYTNDYDDEGRGTSRYLWEEFEGFFKASGYSEEWLLTHNEEKKISTSLYDQRLYKYVSNMTSRYTLHDWAWKRFEDYERNDGRVRRIVIKKCGLKTWHKLQSRAQEIYNKITEEDKRKRTERNAEWQQELAAHKAERIKREGEEKQLIMKEVDLIAGAIQSDFHQAYELRNTYSQDEGEWLDDVVSAVTTGYGFGTEVNSPQGLKLQITLSLDLSNSMTSNRLSKAAASAFRDIYLALNIMKQQYQDNLFIGAFEFCIDTSRGRYDWKGDWVNVIERGRAAKCISHRRYDNSEVAMTDSNLGAVEKYRQPEWSRFDGEDTWFYPLFEQIEEWEDRFSDPGAYRLDLIITDAVIEHPSDIKRSDVIQERRDGALQTILLNLLPEEQWVNSDLPMRCVQYPATTSNLGGMLRNIINEFVGTYM